MSHRDTTTGSVEFFVEPFSDVYAPWQWWELPACATGFVDEQCCEPFADVAWGMQAEGSVHMSGFASPFPAYVAAGVVHTSGQDVTPRPTLKEGSIHVSGIFTWSRTWAALPSGDVIVGGDAAIRFEPNVQGRGSVTVKGGADLQGPLGMGVFVDQGVVHAGGGGETGLPLDIDGPATVHCDSAALIRFEPVFFGNDSVTVQGEGAVELGNEAIGAGVVHVAGSVVKEIGNEVVRAGVVHVAGAATIEIPVEFEGEGDVQVVGSATWSFEEGGSPPPEPGDTCGTAGTLSDGVPVDSGIDAFGSAHWWRMPITNGLTYRVDFTDFAGEGMVGAGVTSGSCASSNSEGFILPLPGFVEFTASGDGDVMINVNAASFAFTYTLVVSEV